jgi:hypothetical protein
MVFVWDCRDFVRDASTVGRVRTPDAFTMPNARNRYYRDFRGFQFPARAFRLPRSPHPER